MRLLRYLNAAFWAKPDVPGLRKVPANALAMVGVGIAGLFNPLIWVAGAAVETVYLGVLASNTRFRRVVDAVSGRKQAPREAARAKRQLTAKLAASDRRQLELFEAGADRTGELIASRAAESIGLAGRSEAQREIESLRFQYLKRMLARHHLKAGLETRMNLKALARDHDRLTRETSSSDLRVTERAARATELQEVEERLARNDRREALVAQLTGDLERIEMRLQQLGSATTTDDRPLELAFSDSSDDRDDVFGTDAPLIRELELSFDEQVAATHRDQVAE